MQRESKNFQEIRVASGLTASQTTVEKVSDNYETGGMAKRQAWLEYQDGGEIESRNNP
jgi:hypothetical protein